MNYLITYVMVNLDTGKKYVNGGLIINWDTPIATIRDWFYNNQITDKNGIKGLVQIIFRDLIGQRLFYEKVYEYDYTEKGIVTDNRYHITVTISKP